MKKSILLGCLMIISLTAFAQESAKTQEILPNNSISITSGVVYNGGFEVSIGTEYFLNTNHIASLYGAVNYLTSSEHRNKNVMAEVGGKCYIPAIKNTLYPYLGLALTAGMQNIEQSTAYEPLLFGGVATVGLEYLLTKNVAINVQVRGKYTGEKDIYFIMGGGLKYCF